MNRAALTFEELSEVLDPPMSVPQLRHLAAALGLPTAGFRSTRGPGRPAATYDAELLMRLHAAVVPFLAIGQFADDNGDKSRTP